MPADRDIVVITGSSGFFGSGLIKRFAGDFAIAGFDQAALPRPPPEAECICINLTSVASLDAAFARLRFAYGNRLSSVIHLAAYFDLTGRPNAKYEEVTVRGTERLLNGLQGFEVEQFVFASSMLVHRARRPGEQINEDWPLESDLPYRASKIAAEKVIHERRGAVPAVIIRPSGVYDDVSRNSFLAQQIARIYERQLASHVYPGNLDSGQSYLHLDDLTDAVKRIVERRRQLPAEVAFLLGEPDVLSFGELQKLLGRLIHDQAWETRKIPKELARVGAWVEDSVLGEEAFVRPWMIDIADDHYALDITRARSLLGWEPQRSLRETLPRIVAALKADPVAWYRANRLDWAIVADRTTAAPRAPEEMAGHVHMGVIDHGDMAMTDHRRTAATDHPQMPIADHMAAMPSMERALPWSRYLVIAFGLWLIASPWLFGLFDASAAGTVRDVTQERGLWAPPLRNALTGWSDIASGLLLVVLGALSLSRRFAWAPWGSTVVGLWLLLAPLLFWTASAAAYLNDTIVGALAIAFSVVVPMMPGMSHEGMMDPSTVPPGWTYSPSSWLQRIPIIVLASIGFVIAINLSAYQLGYLATIWDPFFAGGDGKNGTEFIVTSTVSKAWPIADGGLGAIAYLIEALMGAMGTADRWRTMPWMVTFFFILVVPLGGVSIFFIIIQPIVIGTYCSLCLLAAAAMLVMIPLALDEVVATGQYMLRSWRTGRPLLVTFFAGGPDPLASNNGSDPGFTAPIPRQLSAAVRGVVIPWTLALSCVLGAWLMFSRAIFATTGAAANNDHLIGALIITVAITAMAEVARPLRFVNCLLSLWLIGAPWTVGGASAAAGWNEAIAGVLVLALSLPRGRLGGNRYGSWDRYIA